MTVGATAAEWALLPVARGWAGLEDPAGYAARDVFGVGVAAAFVRGLVLMAHVNPKGPRDK